MIEKTGTFSDSDNSLWFVKIVALSIVLELFMRYFRLPFFPIWLPLFFQRDDKVQMAPYFMLIYAIFSCFILYLLFGVTALDFSLTFLCLVPFIYYQSFWLKKLLKGWRLPLVLTPVWIIFSMILGNFPTGSISFEVLFTAVSIRIVYFEEVAGILSRLLILTMSYSIYPLTVKVLNLTMSIYHSLQANQIRNRA
jgi:hypothetical protein